jgi:hypothetical protein
MREERSRPGSDPAVNLCGGLKETRNGTHVQSLPGSRAETGKVVNLLPESTMTAVVVEHALQNEADGLPPYEMIRTRSVGKLRVGRYLVLEQWSAQSTELSMKRLGRRLWWNQGNR